MKESLSRRLAVYILLIMAATVLTSVAWNYYSSRQTILDMEQEEVESCAGALFTLLDQHGDALDEDRDSERYGRFHNAISIFCGGFDQEATYLYTVDPKTNSRRIVMCVENSDKVVWGEKPEADALPIPDDVLQKEEALLTGDRTFRRIVYGAGLDQKILWLAAYERPEKGDRLYIGMAYSSELENVHILNDFFEDILLPVIALGIAFLVLHLMIRKRVIEPIRLISDSMRRFAQCSESPEPLHIQNQDEIGEIAESFEAMTEEIAAHISDIEKLTKEHVQANVQLDIARRIQYGLVPAKMSMHYSTFCICAMTRPAKGVGGDFYDCFERGDGALCIVMGDVSGKGITGALFMAVIKTIIREKLTLGLSPADVLNHTNSELMEQNPEGLFATVFAAVLDPDTGTLQYANAGHTYPVILGSEASFLVPKEGIALGLFDDAGIVDETIRLAPGQGLVLYTDGVTDALNAQRAFFGSERLLAALQGAPCGPEPAENTLLAVSRAVGAHCGDVDPFDDMAVLVLCMTDAPQKEDMRPLPVSLSAFSEIREAVCSAAGNTPATRAALLACDEALSNIVRYSRADQLAFRCDRQDDKLFVTFSDNGVAFDPTIAIAEEKEFEELDSGGMGLNLIRQTASALRYERKDGRNVFGLEFEL